MSEVQILSPRPLRLQILAVHQHTPVAERRIREAALDETLAGSFPAGDPLSSLPNPDERDAEGSGVGPDDTPPVSPGTTG